MPVLSCFAFKNTNFAQMLKKFAQTCVCTSATFRSSGDCNRWISKLLCPTTSQNSPISNPHLYTDVTSMDFENYFRFGMSLKQTVDCRNCQVPNITQLCNVHVKSFVLLISHSKQGYSNIFSNVISICILSKIFFLQPKL